MTIVGRAESPGGTQAPVTDAPPLGLVGRMFVLTLVALVLLIEILGGLGFLAAVPYAFVGAFLAIRRPRNAVGWLLLAASYAFAFAFYSIPATTAELVAGTTPTPLMAIAILQAWAGGAILVVFFVVTITFPGGRLPTGRWSVPVRLALFLVVMFAVLSLLGPTISVTPSDSLVNIDVPNPLAVVPGSPLWSVLSAGLPVLFTILTAGVASMFVRLRRARGVEREQLRWLVWSMAFLMIGFTVGLVGATVSYGGLGGLVWIPAEIGFVLPPIAIGIAVLRYRLYEIDQIISRTIGYAMVTGVLVVVFAGAILLFQAVLSPLTSGNTVAVAASTLVVAALFQPLRRRVQTRVDRRFNRSRYDAERVVDAFAERLRDEVDLGQLGAEITGAIDETVEPATVTLWLRAGRKAVT